MNDDSDDTRPEVEQRLAELEARLTRLEESTAPFPDGGFIRRPVEGPAASRFGNSWARSMVRAARTEQDRAALVLILYGGYSCVDVARLLAGRSAKRRSA